jgi:NAD(P)-dependent dehydrogenase (short-subunit alcohol dehydrogenase family)/acyl carrier protein
VQFHGCLSTVLESTRHAVLLEVGPGTTLTTLAQRHERLGSSRAIASLRHPKQQIDDLLSLHRAAGQLWCSGISINWNAFAPGAPRRRVALPGYPFERERHWLGDLLGGQREAAVTASARGHEGQARGASYELPSWRQQTRLVNLHELTHRNWRWLVLRSDSAASIEVATLLKQRLEHLAQRVCVAPFDPSDPKAVQNAAEALGGSADVIVDLCDLIASHADEVASAVDATVRIQRIAQFASHCHAVRLLHVTQNVHSVAGESCSGAARSAAIAAARVASREIPSLIARSIDCDNQTSVDALIAEALIDSEEPVIAYRGRGRFVRTTQDVSLPQRRPETGTFRPGGCYVISGGLGGIGLAIARALAQEFGAKLVLLGRTEVPPRDRWDEFTDSTADGAMRKRIDSLRKIEAAAATVMTATADVSNPQQVLAALSAAIQRFGGIDGVIHAAGIAPGGSLMLRTPDDIASVISAKVGGANALMHALGRLGQTPRFIAHCSSLAALIGVPGQIDYSAANAVLDTMAQHADPQTLPRIVSINWDTWSETGMAARAANHPGLGAAQEEALRNGLQTPDAVEAFFRAVESGLPQVIVASRPVEPRMSIGSFAAQQTESKAVAPPVASPGPTQSSYFDAAPTSLAERVAQIWREFLGVRESKSSDDFFEMGGHSLLAVQMVHRIQEQFDVEIGPDAIFASPTLGALTSHVQSLVDAKSAPAPEPSESLLAMVESLSDEQVQALLEKELSAQGS